MKTQELKTIQLPYYAIANLLHRNIFHLPRAATVVIMMDVIIILRLKEKGDE
jgi:hypothetical protein